MSKGLITRRNLLLFAAGSSVGGFFLPLSKLGYRRYQVQQLTRQARNFNVSGERSLAERAAAGITLWSSNSEYSPGSKLAYG